MSGQELNSYAVVFGIIGFMLAVFLLMALLYYCIIEKCGKPKAGVRRAHSCEDFSQPQTECMAAPSRQATVLYDDYGGFVSSLCAASPVVVPPYPVEPRHPTPNVGAPGLGFATHNPPYPTHNPHPTGGVPYHPAVGATPYPPVGATPYPPAVGSTPYPPSTGSTPYPPVGGSAPYPDYAAQPPSYSEAVAQPPAQPLPSKDGYSKQAPYNPNY